MTTHRPSDRSILVYAVTEHELDALMGSLVGLSLTMWAGGVLAGIAMMQGWPAGVPVGFGALTCAVVAAGLWRMALRLNQRVRDAEEIVAEPFE